MISAQASVFITSDTETVPLDPRLTSELVGPLGPSQATAHEMEINLSEIKGIAGATRATDLPLTQGLLGPQGPIGETGLTGAIGATGLTGAIGATGLTGLTGSIGATGATGSTGEQGEVGPQGPTSAQGPIGPQGIQGIQGVQGPLGPQGNQGTQGSTGRQGIQGTQGSAGSSGSSGAVGPQGPTGPTGPTGSQGANGAQGAVGPQGPIGTRGEIGLQGPQGAKGDKGNTGDTGLTGDRGPVGGMGAYGSFSSTEIQEAQGAQITRVTFNSKDEGATSGVSLEGNSKITFEKAGTYNIEFSAQLWNKDAAKLTSNTAIWLSKNGDDVPLTASWIYYDKYKQKSIEGWNFFITVNAGDYCELLWWDKEGNTQMLAEPAQTEPVIIPAVPSVILTVNQVGESK